MLTASENLQKTVKFNNDMAGQIGAVSEYESTVARVFRAFTSVDMLVGRLHALSDKLFGEMLTSGDAEKQPGLPGVVGILDMQASYTRDRVQQANELLDRIERELLS